MNKSKTTKAVAYFNTEEKELAEFLESSDLKALSLEKKDQMVDNLAAAVKNTQAKRKTVNLRLTERDLLHFRIKAAEEGMPYQTLMTSVLHKHIVQ
jgi:predicted DNA binding CopG/RHH family protein